MSFYEESVAETVQYECSVCQKTHNVTSDDMREIAETFENLGWGNHAFDTDEGVVYIVLCKEHNTADRLALLSEHYPAQEVYQWQRKN